jgi:hypothetical protein
LQLESILENARIVSASFQEAVRCTCLRERSHCLGLDEGILANRDFD